jgi:hypothetical protein
MNYFLLEQNTEIRGYPTGTLQLTSSFLANTTSPGNTISAQREYFTRGKSSTKNNGIRSP